MQPRVQCCCLEQCGIGPQLIWNSTPFCDGYSPLFREYQQGIRQWLELVNDELPTPLYAKILSYRLCGEWAWTLEIATTEEAVRAL